MWLYVPGPCQSSLFAAGSTGSPSESISPWGERLASFATWSGRSIPPRSWSRAWQRAHWLRLLSGLTCDPSMADRGAAAFVASLDPLPASPSPAPVGTQVCPTNAGSGPTFSASSARWDRGSSSWRTCPSSASTDCLSSPATFPTSGIVSRGELYPRAISAPRRSGTGSGSSLSWPTPTAAASGEGVDRTGSGRGRKLHAQAKAWPTPTANTYGSTNNGCPGDGRAQYATAGTPSLTSLARDWPTPTRQDASASGSRCLPGSGAHPGTSLTDAAVRQWPTPTARDGTSGPGLSTTAEGMPNLRTVAANWPTPRASDHKGGDPLQRAREGAVRPESDDDLGAAAARWGTPNARDSKGRGYHEGDLTRQATGLLAATPSSGATSLPSTTRLNPAFVEWLMGLPNGWSDVTPGACGATAFAVWEIRSCQLLRQWLSSISGAR